MTEPNNEWRLLLAALGTGVAKCFHAILGGKENKHSLPTMAARSIMSCGISIASGYALVLLARAADIPHAASQDTFTLIAMVGAWGGAETMNFVSKKFKKANANDN